MNALKKRGLIDKLRDAVRAFNGVPVGSIVFGMEIKRCDECTHYRNDTFLRDNLLVTTGARAAYMDDANVITLPRGLEGEQELTEFVAKSVDYYLNCEDEYNFDEFIEIRLEKQYGFEKEE